MRRPPPLSSWLLTLVAGLAFACDSSTPNAGNDAGRQSDAGLRDSGGVESDAALSDGGKPADAADAKTPSDTGDVTALPECTAPIENCPAHESAKWQALLEASVFGDAARLVALDGRAILVDLGDGTFRVARVFDQQEVDPGGVGYTSWTVPRGDMAPIAVADNQSAGSPGEPEVVALFCNSSRAACSLMRGFADRPALEPWSGSELPAGFVARGVVFDMSTSPSVCVYGNGLLCFDGMWKTGIPVDPALRLNDVAMGRRYSLAVGDEGRWYKREGDYGDILAPWNPQPALGTTSLTRASTAELGGVIVGGGRLQAVLGEQRAVYDCAIDRQVEAQHLYSGFRGVSIVVTTSGEILEHAKLANRPAPYCVQDQLPAGAILATSTAPCGISFNPRVLTAKALYGLNECALD